MKKFLLSLVALMAIGVSAWADGLSIADAEVLPGMSTTIQLYLENTSGTAYRDFGFTFNLPEGLTRDTSKDGITAGDNLQEAASIMPGGQTLVMCVPDQDAVDAGLVDIRDYYITTSGVLLNIRLNASADLEVGTVLEGSLVDFELSNTEGKAAIRTEVPFKVTVVNTMTLDELSTVAPVTYAKNDVKVKRTFKKDEWSTICMPFALNATVLKAAFGEDATYQLAQLDGYTVEKSGDDITGITINFKTVAGAKANQPCIIKVNKDITEFNVNVAISPAESKIEITETDDETFEEVVTCSMVGTYVANTVVPKNSIFLSGNQFWYSTGKTKMKGYRAYITLKDELAGINLEDAGVKVGYAIDPLPTAINNVEQKSNGSVYDLGGRKVSQPRQKGVYIVDGKKVAVK